MGDQEYQSIEQRLEALEARVGTVEQSADDAAREREEATQVVADDLPVTVVRREDQGMAELGVTYEGAFLPLASVKLGHLDTRVQAAREQAEQQQAEQSE